mmetsp:Transcript_39558/g.85436  ORF Transcript_39558/g.85436 Transcript_39558/m.85436 type:complete len:213 (-) Transcript_39558:310-948(-)
MAVDTMANIAPPVMPSMSAVAESRFLARSEPRATLAGMMSEPIMARSPVSVNSTIHISRILDTGIFCPRNRLLPLKASGKLAIKIATRKLKVTEPSLVMKPSMRASGIPSSIIPSHMDSATCADPMLVASSSSSNKVEARLKLNVMEPVPIAGMKFETPALATPRPPNSILPVCASSPMGLKCRASPCGLERFSSHRFSNKYMVAPSMAPAI